MEIINEWLSKNLENYKNKKGDIVYYEDKVIKLDKDVVDHIVDWMKSNDASRHRKRLLRISVPDAYRLSILWTKKLHKKFKKLKKVENELKEVESILKLEDGYFFVKLKTEYSFLEEGDKMHHCVADYYERDCEIYSLRDKDNNPHCTIEISDNICTQIKGRGNKEVVPKYHKKIINFLNSMDFQEVSEFDLKKINAYSFGNYIIHKDNTIPRELVINKKLTVKNIPLMKHQFNSLEINGDLIINNVLGKEIFADEIIVHGDLLIEDLEATLRLCNKLKVLGDVEIVNSHDLRILSKEMDIQGNVLVEDCESLLNKFNCQGEIEFYECEAC